MTYEEMKEDLNEVSSMIEEIKKIMKEEPLDVDKIKNVLKNSKISDFLKRDQTDINFLTFAQDIYIKMITSGISITSMEFIILAMIRVHESIKEVVSEL